jgi:dynamin 1-like protein
MLECRIQDILVKHIKQRLPELQREVAVREQRKREELDSLGECLSEKSGDALTETMLRYLTVYSRNFSDGLQGKPFQCRLGIEGGQEALIGGARIRHVFQTIFGGVLDSLDPCNGLTDEQVRAGEDSALVTGITACTFLCV